MPDHELQVQTNELADMAAWLEDRRGGVADVAASNIDPERLMKVVLQTISRSDELMRCTTTPQGRLSIYRAIHEAASVGLEPTGAVGGAHLVPYGGEAQLIYDYRGLIQLARRSGEVRKVVARVVRTRDHFEVTQGSTEELVHVPYLDGDAGAPTHVYCVVTFRDGTTQFDWDTWAWVQTVKRRAPGGGRRGPWSTDEVEMAKKSIIRRAMKLVPQAVEVATAIAYEEAREAHTAPVAVPAPDGGGVAAIQARVGVPQPAAAPEPVALPDATAPAGDGDPGPTEPPKPKAKPKAKAKAKATRKNHEDPEPEAPPQAAAAAESDSVPADDATGAVAAGSGQPAPVASDDTGRCQSMPPTELGMTEQCGESGVHRVHRSSEGTWPLGSGTKAAGA
jgi:recombination protein RecT